MLKEKRNEYKTRLTEEMVGIRDWFAGQGIKGSGKGEVMEGECFPGGLDPEMLKAAHS